jgi:type IV pilus assembly protein PilV
MSRRNSISGFTMLEVLISIIVIAFGLLGVAGLQAFAIKNNQSASMRITATTLATDLVDRIRSNYLGLSNGYYNQPDLSAYGTQQSSCISVAGCTSQQLAQNDLYEWSQRVAAALPGGTGIVCVDGTSNDGVDATTPACDGNGTNLYVVKIWWRDDRSATGSAAAPQRFTWPFNP